MGEELSLKHGTTTEKDNQKLSVALVHLKLRYEGHMGGWGG